MTDYSFIESKCDLCSNYETRYAGNIAVGSRCKKGLAVDKKIWEHCEGFKRREIGKNYNTFEEWKRQEGFGDVE